ncbi:MAG: glutamate-1-semialdehyde 2,1-aminomutase [Rhodocyclaceae bacterium]|jgi:glutamate-1-semialdehyde 2,1-aminomutase|nr:glutamate-1-semialdehyde 2,1-aminomutase [Rhodocyclaceae bacterium]MCE2722764.1 glutamate-1-semialdehyde 2,1-aminomutase [Betaproteobacteria bacterium]MCA3025691.1 glutamate-1-semialdehyde 2,1-aminomutase [Rhodocyclaceae bacterium]MCA3031126.1 glutamate-1-semialdehyde 2,1-aminomutase [Rhodocyclaceae bacterium]MCA3038420.1 glutamate-1-semialdehyde 2,1-aminomutase [Rhodocyclaceae bacterium]
MFEQSQALFEKSLRVIPGGVNSPVRAFRSVGGTPVFFRKANGAYLWDADGTKYIDYVGSWGPAILGHAHPEVVAAVQATALDGLSFGAPTEAELLMAERLCELVPSIEQVRLVSSGTEATMSAIRLARGATGRKKIIKFEGCYHGHADALLVKAGSGALTFGNPSSAGVPPEVAADTIVLGYNNLFELESTFAGLGSEIACVIIEPIAGNMNFIVPDAAYMRALRSLCSKHGAVLIFDEVMTGFRVGLHGVQGHFGITPDLTTLGKVIGGGMPMGAFGGRRDLMANMAPLGGVYQAGTLSGNPVSVAAGLKTLELIARPGFFEELSATTAQLCEGLTAVAREEGQTFSAASLGGMFGMFFSPSPPTSYAEVMASDREQFNRFFHGMLARGVYLAPSAFEAGFVSKAHTATDIADTIARASETFRSLAKG